MGPNQDREGGMLLTMPTASWFALAYGEMQFEKNPIFETISIRHIPSPRESVSIHVPSGVGPLPCLGH